MTTAKKASAKKGKGEAYTKDSRCWPGYEPVPSKGEHEEGSCRKVPASKNGGKEVNRETARKKQIAMGGKRAEQAKSKSPSAAERRSVSKAAKTAGQRSTAAKKSGPRKTPTKKTATKAPAKRPSTKGGAAKKAPAKRASAGTAAK